MRILPLIMVLLFSVASSAQETFPVFVNGQPPVSSFTGSEKSPVIQGGVTKSILFQGSTGKIPLTVAGTVGNCVQYDSNLNLAPSGSACGGGGGSGTVTSASQYSVPYYPVTGTTVAGLPRGTAGQVLTTGGSAAAPSWQYPAQVVTVSANNTCATDATSAIQAALNTGNTVKLPRGCYLVSSDLTFTTKNQILMGDGPGCYSTLSGVCTGGPYGTVIYASNPAGFTHGILYFNTGEQGPQIQDLGISLAQPDTATRSSLTAWAPEISAEATPRFRLANLRLEGCIVCVDMKGNSGGSYLDQLQLSGYGTVTSGGGIIEIDGSLDTVRITNTHIYNFDMTSNQVSIFYQPGTVGINSGRMDDLQVSNLLTICGTGMVLFYGTGGPGGTSWQPGPTFGTITGSGFDTFNGIVANGSGSGQTGPTLAISASYFSLGNSSVQAIVATAGNFQLASVNIGQGNGGANPVVGLGDSTGSLNFSWDSGYMLNAGNDTIDISVAGDSNCVVLLNDIRFIKAQNTNYTRPAINIGSGPRATITNNSIIDKGTGTGTFINIAADAFHVVMGNSAPGWTLTFPTATDGIYTCNTTGSSPSCGSGGGSSTPTFTSVNSNTYNDAAGNNLLAVSAGQTYLGNPTDGSVLLKTSIAPNGAGAFLNGTSTNYWSQVWGGALGVAGSSSGAIQIQGQAAAGTYNFILPNTAGSSGQCLTSGGGGAMSWANCSTPSKVSWTPVLTIGGSATGITYSTQLGYYQTSGSVTEVEFYLQLTSKGSNSGTVSLTGLPVSADALGGSCTVGTATGMASMTSTVTSNVTGSSTSSNLTQMGSSGASPLTNSNLTNSTLLVGTCTYFH